MARGHQAHAPDFARHRTGCWCSARRSSGAPGRRRRRRASASSARTWCAVDGVTSTAACRPRRARARPEVMITNFRSSPRLGEQRRDPRAVAAIARFGLQRRADLARRAHVPRSPCWPPRGSRACAPTWRAAPVSGLPSCQKVSMKIESAAAEHRPRLLGREAEEGRHPAQHRVRDVPQRGLRGAARERLRRRGVEAVLQHVEVERAEVFGAVDLQLGDDRVELVDLVVREHLGLQLRRARERVAVDLQQVGQRHRVRRRVEVARRWPAGSAACCGCGGRRRPRAPGSCRRRRCRPSSRTRPPTGG